MRIYLEALEQVEAEAEFVRLDVTDKTEAEKDTILTSLKDFMTGLSCQFTKHTCYHQEGGQPCVVVEV